MNRTTRFHVPEHDAARNVLHVIGQAPARGLATGIAIVRLVQIARQARLDDPSGALEPIRPQELGPWAVVSDPTGVRPPAREVHPHETRPAA